MLVKTPKPHKAGGSRQHLGKGLRTSIILYKKCRKRGFIPLSGYPFNLFYIRLLIYQFLGQQRGMGHALRGQLVSAAAFGSPRLQSANRNFPF